MWSMFPRRSRHVRVEAFYFVVESDLLKMLKMLQFGQMDQEHLPAGT